MTKHATLIGSIVLVLAACETPHLGGPPPTTTPTSNCVRMVLSNGHAVCLQGSPLGTPSAMSTTHDGAAVEPLTDPDLTGMTPISIDLRTTILDGCIQIRDQGECGWCVAHASGNALDALYCAEGCSAPRVSMPALWYAGHGNQFDPLDCGLGWTVEPGMQTVTGATPLIAEGVWPFSGTIESMQGSQPSAATLAQDPRYLATSYTSITISHDAAELDAIKHILASRRAVVVWSQVCSTGEWQAGTSTIQQPVADCDPAGLGNHAYLLVGFDDTTQQFLGLNSWGTSWGDGGYMHIAYDWAQHEIQEAYYLSQIDRSHGACGTTTTADASMRCAAIQDCDACQATSGCAFCDGHCALAADGCQRTTCGLPINGCGIHNDCGECAADSACAWCAGHSACLAWPGDYLSCEDGSRVATAAAQCNAATGACNAALDCGACTALAGCGWCDVPDQDAPHCTGASTDGMNTDGIACGAADFVGHGEACHVIDAGAPEIDAGMSDPDASIDCASLGCGDCVATFGCEFCAADRRCYDDSVAGTCAGDVTRNAAVCDECHDPGGTCTTRDECCGATTNSNIQCIDHVCNDTTMCVMNGSACAPTGTACCGGNLCGINPSTATECCLTPGYECTSDAQCCGYERCTGGLCQARHAGEACLNTEECEGGSWCLDSNVCGTS